jgi:GrpB-like predicted nucleotidyltransferase (UPF0157 family)
MPDDLGAVAARHTELIVGALPGAEVHLTGTASVPGLAANDVDLVALVADVTAAAAELRHVYAPLYEDHWSDTWAAFRAPGPPQVDVVLTRRGTTWDALHRRAWELLRDDPALLEEYAEAKQTPEGKHEFFERVVRLLPPG